jgi:hypothetical protein
MMLLAFTGVSALNLTDNNEGYWSLDDTYLDITPNTNDMTNFSNAKFVPNGKINQAVNFPGSGYLRDGSITDGWSELTVSAWFNADTSGSLDTILSEYTASNDRNFLVRYNSNEMFFGIGNSANSFASFTSSNASISPGTWYFVTMVYDGSTIQGYINGESVGSTAQTGVLDTTTAEFQIGAYAGNTQTFDGLIDEASVWDRALNITEVRQLYNNGNGLQYPYLPDEPVILIENVSANGAPFINNSFWMQDYMYFELDLINESTNSNINTTFTLYNSSNMLVEESTVSNTLNPAYNFTGLPDEVYFVNFFAFNNETNASTGNYTFTIDLTPPTINNTLPAEINSYLLNLSQYISCEEIGNGYCNITFQPDNKMYNVSQPDLVNFTYNGNQTYSVMAVDDANNTVTENGTLLVNPYAYFNFKFENGTKIEDYTLAGIPFQTEANISLYSNEIGGLGVNKTLLFEKFGLISRNITFNVTNTSRINLTETITSSTIVVQIFDRDTGNLLVGENVTVTLVSTVGFQGSTITGLINISNPSFISEEYQLIATNPNYETETVFFNFDNQEILNLNIFMLNSTGVNLGVINIDVKDSGAALVEGALVKLLEWVPSQSAFVSKAEALTNANGRASLNIELGVKLYKFLATKNGVSTLTNSEIIYNTDELRIIVLQDIATTTPFLFQNLEYNITQLEPSNTTDQIVFYWNDLDNLVYTGCIEAFNVTRTGRNELIPSLSSCADGSTGQIQTPVFLTNTSSTINFEVSLSAGGQTQIFQTFIYRGVDDISKSLAFWGISILLPLALFLIGWSVGIAIQFEAVGVILGTGLLWVGVIIAPTAITTAVAAIITVFAILTVIGGHRRK